MFLRYYFLHNTPYLCVSLAYTDRRRDLITEPAVKSNETVFDNDTMARTGVPTVESSDTDTNIMARIVDNTEKSTETASSFLKFEDMGRQYQPVLVKYAKSAELNLNFSKLKYGIGIFDEAIHVASEPAQYLRSESYCECCKRSYWDLKEHLNSFHHRVRSSKLC